ncbi:MAG: DUF370 domain-containing protein [Selenomonas sp.]|uniref:extracellular matrix regulator RemB n=1 Tax=Selenomonas sp. TaxID=2053611 RepID=UPI0025F77DD4|nr:extracellular matrix/biofilm biosynthesis regulator RemA family protein [Selenomonas sp.]MCR5439920.1 DUF370 domain-containing protein [Selenomonas sp.]
MFLHLGNGVSVRTKDVIAIQDFSLFQNGPGKDLLAAKREAGLVVNTLELGPEDEHESIKALVLTEDKIYLSVISPLTLKRRSELAFTTIDAVDSTKKTTETSLVTE